MNNTIPSNFVKTNIVIDRHDRSLVINSNSTLKQTARFFATQITCKRSWFGSSMISIFSLNPILPFPCRFMSSHNAIDRDDDVAQDKPISLRKLAQPFLLTYHPDRIASSTDDIRTINLAAVQTLNGFIDCIESLYNRAGKRNFQHHGRIELQHLYSVEFMVPKSKNPSSRGDKHHSVSTLYTRRCVEIIFSQNDQISVQTVDGQGLYCIQAATLVRNKARREIIKLLNLAGLQVPKGADLKEEFISRENAFEAHFLHEELNLENPKSHRPFTERRELTPLEISRREFMKTMDWKKQRRMYYDALDDMKRDLYTDGLIGDHEERKETFLSHVLSRVRMESPDMDPIQQLFAIRRMSELLMDNFHVLEIEEMGRMWETLVFVLIPPCNNHHESQAPKNKGVMDTRVSRKFGKDTGFKFTVHSDNSVSIYLPVDFTDENFLGEMKANLADFYDFCVSSDGLDEFFPPYYKEWISEVRSKGRI